MEVLMRRRGVYAAALVLCALFAGGFFSQRPAEAANGSVSIAGFAFSPASVTINPGESVTWTHNDGTTPHTVTSNTGAFDSGSLTGGGTFQQTFSTPGTFAYHCAIHPSMQGTVVVTGAEAPTNTPQPTATTAATSTPAATSTAPAATATPSATATTAATATATTAAPTATAVQPTAAPSSTATRAATASSSTTPSVLPPNTGDSGGDGGSNLPWVMGGLIVLLAIGGVGATVLLRNRAT